MLNWIVRNRTVRSFNCEYLQSMFINHIFDIYVYLGLDYQQRLISHKTKPN